MAAGPFRVNCRLAMRRRDPVILLTVGLTDLFSRRRKDEPDADSGVVDAPVQPTKALGKFLASLSSHEQPQLLDLGPVVGSNVNFFGEQLGCKIFVEDLSKDIDRHRARGQARRAAGASRRRASRRPTRSVDGILCWDLFDYLDKAAGAVAGRRS